MLWWAALAFNTACGSDKGGSAATSVPSATATGTSSLVSASASPTAARSSDPQESGPTSGSAKTAHAELSIHKVTTPASIADEVPGVRKGTTTPENGSKFVLVEAAIRTLDCVVDTGGPPPSALPRGSASAVAVVPKIAPVASEAAALIGTDGTRVVANGGGETADSVCTGCDASYNPPCNGDKPPDALVTMFFLFSVPSSFDLSRASFEYADTRARLPPLTK